MNKHLTALAVSAAFITAACSGSPITTTNSQFTRADRNADGTLEMSEYYQLIEIQAKDGYPLAESLSKEPTMEKMGKLESRFKYLDTNNDGKLERTELGIY